MMAEMLNMNTKSIWCILIYERGTCTYDEPKTKMSKYVLAFWNEMEKNQTI